MALVIAAAVFSHWLLDPIVHTPDLPLLGDNSAKLGLGLWNNAAITFILEGVFLLAGLWLYLLKTKGTTFGGKYGMIIFAVVLILYNVFNIFGPLPASDSALPLVIFVLVIYLAISGIGFWLDRKRA